MTEEEKAEFFATAAAEEDVDKTMADNTIMSAILEIDNEEKKKLVSSIVREKSEMSDDEKREMVEKFLADASEMEEKFKNQQEYSEAVVAAKLAARKRLRDQKLKEAALKKELDALSAKQVIFIGI